MPWVKEVRGRVVRGEERAAVMSLPDRDKGTGVATHRLTHQTHSFSLHDWIILILV